MNIEDQKSLDSQLKKLERFVLHIPYAARSEILEEVKIEISEIHQTQNKSFKQIIAMLGGPKTILDRLLVKRGLPKARETRNVGKVILLSILGIFIIGGVFLYFFVQSFFPLVEIDSKDNHISFFGGKVVLKGDEQGNYSYSNISYNSQKFLGDKVTGDLSVGGAIVHLDFNQAALNLAKSKDALFHYSCKTHNDERPEVDQKQGLYFHLNQFSECDIDVPTHKELKIEVNQGSLNLQDITQKYSIELDMGHVSITMKDPSILRINVTADRGEVEGNVDAYTKNDSKKESIIHVKNGRVIFN
ncbi:MAG: hypothetical protein HOE90_00740 [Bacteriovoracaceae bacterium]|jgi:hypothetical protein|nr:hypothetical protein [Bacteriovoracaceae bacterium]